MATKIEQYENRLLKAIQLHYPKVRDSDFQEYYSDETNANKAARAGEKVIFIQSFGMYCVINENAL